MIPKIVVPGFCPIHFTITFAGTRCYTKDCYIKLGSTVVRPDFSYSLAYDNFFQRSNVEGQNKNKNKMSQNKDIT